MFGSFFHFFGCRAILAFFLEGLLRGRSAGVWLIFSFFVRRAILFFCFKRGVASRQVCWFLAHFFILFVRRAILAFFFLEGLFRGRYAVILLIFFHFLFAGRSWPFVF